MSELRSTRTSFLVGLATLVLVVAACGDDDGEPATTTSEPTTTVGTTAVPTTSSEQEAGAGANVYWTWSVQTVSSGTPERLGAGARSGAVDPASAVAQLLEGPDATETEIGMGTSIPPDTELLGVEVDAGTATVDLSSAFEASGGTLGETMRTAQVVFTLTQFEDVDTVAFRIDGADVDALGSHGLDVAGGVDRDDFADVRPHVLLEQPAPGATLGDEVVLSGETDGPSIEWVLTDGDGLIVAEGSETSGATSDTWVDFEIAVDVPDELEGRGAVIVFGTATDGAQVDVVEHPVRY